jgi:hypothetical protein
MNVTNACKRTGRVVAVLGLAGLCRCSILFDLSALDEAQSLVDASPGNDAGISHDGGSDSDADATDADARDADATDAGGDDAASDTTADTAGPDAGVDASDSGRGNASDGSYVDSGADAPTVSAPSVPMGLTKTNVTSSSITLSWTASTDPGSGVAHYNVYRNGTKVGTPSSTSFTDTGLSASTSYSYTVSAVDPSGNTSAQSAALSITTAATSCSFSVPNVSNGGACACTGNCYDNSWDGCFTIRNTGSFAMTNPVVAFKVPSNITSIAETASSNVPPGFTETASLNAASSTITISYGGTLAAGASILVYYTDNNQSGPAATNIAVTASNCR